MVSSVSADCPAASTEVSVDIEADANEARITHAQGHFLGGEIGVSATMPIKAGTLGVARATVTTARQNVLRADRRRARRGRRGPRSLVQPQRDDAARQAPAHHG